MTSKRLDTHDPEGSFEKIRSSGSRGSKQQNRIRKLASEIGREPEGLRVVVPEHLVPAVTEMVQARLNRELERGQGRAEVPIVVSSAREVRQLKRVLVKDGEVVDGNKPGKLLVHRIRAGVSAGGGVEITKSDDKRMDQWKP